MAKRHFLAAYLLKTTGNKPQPDELMDAIESFATSETKMVDMEDAQRVLRIERFRRDTLRATAVLKTGEYGLACTMVDRTDETKTKERTENDADLLPLHLVLDLGVAGPGPLAVFHKLGRQGVRTSFERQLNKHLRAADAGYQVQFTRVAPALAVEEWAKRGHVARLTFHKRETGTDAIGKLELIAARMADNPDTKRKRKPQPMAVDRSLTIHVRWGHFAMEKIMTWLRGEDPQAKDLAELVDVRGFDPDDVDITLDTGDHRTKKFRFGSALRMDADISGAVPNSRDEEQLRTAVYGAARDYIEQLSD